MSSLVNPKCGVPIFQMNNMKDLSGNKNEDISNQEKKFDFSKIYKNTYLFAMVLILANFI